MKIKIKSWKNGKIERQFQNSPQVILKYDCPGYSVQQILLQSLSVHLISWKLIAYYDAFGLGKCSLVVTGLFFSSGKGTAVDRLVWFVDLVNMLLISFERGEESVST